MQPRSQGPLSFTLSRKEERGPWERGWPTVGRELTLGSLLRVKEGVWALMMVDADVLTYMSVNEDELRYMKVVEGV